jgi:L-malate glycosyltransferase
VADGLALTSHWGEGISNAVIEGLASGAPVVVSPAANVDAVVHDGIEGFACSSSKQVDVERGLARFFALTVEKRRTMGARGRATAVTRFSVPRMVARTCEVYERVLATSPTGSRRRD